MAPKPVSHHGAHQGVTLSSAFLGTMCTICEEKRPPEDGNDLIQFLWGGFLDFLGGERNRCGRGCGPSAKEHTATRHSCSSSLTCESHDQDQRQGWGVKGKRRNQGDSDAAPKQ